MSQSIITLTFACLIDLHRPMRSSSFALYERNTTSAWPRKHFLEKPTSEWCKNEAAVFNPERAHCFLHIFPPSGVWGFVFWCVSSGSLPSSFLSTQPCHVLNQPGRRWAFFGRIACPNFVLSKCNAPGTREREAVNIKTILERYPSL